MVKALPKMAKAASTPDLKKAFEGHLKETKTHVERLEKIFKKLGKKPSGKTCKEMKGLVEEGSGMTKEEGSGVVIDAGLIGAAHRVEHYEMAAAEWCAPLPACLARAKRRSSSKLLWAKKARPIRSCKIAEGFVNEEADEAGMKKAAAKKKPRARR